MDDAERLPARHALATGRGGVARIIARSRGPRKFRDGPGRRDAAAGPRQIYQMNLSRGWLDTFLPQKTLLAPRSRPSRRGDSRSRSRPARRIDRARALATRMTRSPPDAPSPLDVARLELTLTSRDDELARARATADELRAALGRAEEKVKAREADIDAARARAERLEATVADLDVRAKVLVEREVALRSHLRATETALERATSEAKTLAADAAREAAAAIPSPRDQHRPLDRSILTLAGAIEEEIRRVERRVEDAERLAAERAELVADGGRSV